ncbi:MAG: methyltransferase domain-containing protein [Candidatus Aminicenantes bacterium]|nr:MAG: methyltransferase domain-containing protein [Candidatus Aminicenantes bacterium]
MNSKKYFDEVARKWDEMQQSFFSEEVREKAFSIAGVKAGEIAADIGAGTGFVTEGLMQKGLEVIAVDQSEAMLDEMRKKFADAKGVEYRTGEAEKLPIQDDSVDYAFANMYLHHVELPLDAIKEMARILKPGGRLVITDMDEHKFDFLIKEHHDRWMGFKREDVKKWFSEAGFKDIVIDCVGECCAQSGLKEEYAEVSIFVASGVK